MDEQRIARELLEALGGVDNIDQATHCATRLRVMVKDRQQIDDEEVEEIDQVKGAFYNSGQYQVIFGTGTVNRVYQALEPLLGQAKGGEDASSEDQVTSQADGTWWQGMIRTFGDVFVPIIPVLVATGLFMGLRGLLMQDAILNFFGIQTVNEHFILWTEILTDTAFAFLPALVAWSSFRVFGGNPVLGIVLGLMLVHPALPNAYAVAAGDESPLIFFNFIPVVGYQGTVLPAFFVGLLGAKLEQWLHRHVSATFDLLVVPFLTFLVMSTLGLFVIGPVFHSFETVILSATTWILGLPFGLAGLIIGGLQQIIVVTGVHHIFNFLEVQLLSQTGVNPINAYFTAAMASQAGAVFAVGVKTKDARLKALTFTSGISCLLGITEPAIFGVNLRYGRPFVMGLIGGAIGGFVANLLNLAGVGMSVTVLPGTLLYLDRLLPYLLMMTLSLAAGFVLTYLFGYSDQMAQREVGQ